MRRAILAKRARLDDIEVPPDVLAEIASRVTTSVRALEGALIRVVAYASLKGEPATPALARHVLRRLGEDDAAGRLRASTRSSTPPPRSSGSNATALLARDRRPARGDRARQVAMYLARELTEHSLPEIGRGIGGRNHTTVYCTR